MTILAPHQYVAFLNDEHQDMNKTYLVHSTRLERKKPRELVCEKKNRKTIFTKFIVMYLFLDISSRISYNSRSTKQLAMQAILQNHYTNARSTNLKKLEMFYGECSFTFFQPCYWSFFQSSILTFISLYQ